MHARRSELNCASIGLLCVLVDARQYCEVVDSTARSLQKKEGGNAVAIWHSCLLLAQDLSTQVLGGCLADDATPIIRPIILFSTASPGIQGLGPREKEKPLPNIEGWWSLLAARFLSAFARDVDNKSDSRGENGRPLKLGYEALCGVRNHVPHATKRPQHVTGEVRGGRSTTKSCLGEKVPSTFLNAQQDFPLFSHSSYDTAWTDEVV